MCVRRRSRVWEIKRDYDENQVVQTNLNVVSAPPPPEGGGGDVTDSSSLGTAKLHSPWFCCLQIYSPLFSWIPMNSRLKSAVGNFLYSKYHILPNYCFKRFQEQICMYTITK